MWPRLAWCWRLVVVNPHWQPTWLVLPWLLGIGGIIIAHARLGDKAAAGLAIRVRQMTVLCAASSAVKLLSLWDLPTYLLPFITFLWSPHCTWALGLSWLLYLHLPAVGKENANLLTPMRASLVALAIALSAYGAYTFYFCQVTLLHGDEGQYLRGTQSLLRGRRHGLGQQSRRSPHRRVPQPEIRRAQGFLFASREGLFGAPDRTLRAAHAVLRTRIELVGKSPPVLCAGDDRHRRRGVSLSVSYGCCDWASDPGSHGYRPQSSRVPPRCFCSAISFSPTFRPSSFSWFYSWPRRTGSNQAEDIAP